MTTRTPIPGVLISNAPAIVAAAALAFVIALSFRPPPADDDGANAALAPDDPYWTSAGAAAFVDESDTNVVAFTGPAVSIRPSAPASSNLLVRYNVTTTANLALDDDRLFLQARFRDNGNQARVILKLRQVHMGTGVNTLLLTLDSNDYPASTIYQLQFVAGDAGMMPVDFNLHFYYVEAIISRGSATGTSALLGVAVGRY